ncbi:hypothetical protein Ciccas_005689 [Cichlidogyrus casuarinus]|uniref:BED-type domain-containing protein n=1 Tax=Cichlidogyrus casuarinus TaxID=1844966 RepID=A0ABD2Q7Z3_9PLAT
MQFKTDMTDQEFYYEDFFELGVNCSICKRCSSQIAGVKKISNLKRHLTLKHGINFKPGRRNKRPRSKTNQPSISSFVSNKNEEESQLTKYLRNAPPDALAELQTELFEITLEMGLPFSFFHAMPIKKRLDKWIPYFPIPSRQNFARTTAICLDDLHLKMVNKLSSKRHLSLMVDRWSDGDNLDLLGLSAYFYDIESGTRGGLLLGLAFLDSFHREERFAEWIKKVLGDFHVPLEKILLCYIDNNKNQIIGCKNLFRNLVPIPDETFGHDDDEDSQVSNTEFDLFGSDMEEDDQKEECEEANDVSPSEIFLRLSDQGCISLASFVMKIPSPIYAVEMLVNDLMSSICMHDVLPALGKLRGLNHKFRTSKAVQQYMKQENQMNLPFENVTRWIATFEMLQQYLHLHATGVLTTIIEIFNVTEAPSDEIEISPLEPEEIEKLKIMERVLDLIANLLGKFQLNEASLSCVIPHIMDLKESVREMGENSDSFPASTILAMIKNNFDWALNPDSNSFVDLAAMATYLDNKYKIYLEVQTPESASLLKSVQKAMLNQFVSVNMNSRGLVPGEIF